MAVVVGQTVFPQGEEKCVGAENARPMKQVATAETHCGQAQAGDSAALWEDDSIPAGSVPHDWVQDGNSVVPWVDGWARADRWAVLWADDSIRVAPTLHDWGQDGCWVGLKADGSAQADRWALLWAGDSVLAYSAPADLVVQTARGSTQADYSGQGGRHEQHCFLAARPVHWPVAERRPDSEEGYRDSLTLWRVRLRGR